MAGRKSRGARQQRAAEKIQYNMTKDLDRLAAFREFEDNFAPEIRKALLSGKSEKDIMERYKPLIGARLVQIAMTGEDGHALGASKEILERLDGKSVAKAENTHKFQKLPDAELDAIVASKIAQVETLSKPVQEEPEDDDESDK